LSNSIWVITVTSILLMGINLQFFVSNSTITYSKPSGSLIQTRQISSYV